MLAKKILRRKAGKWYAYGGLWKDLTCSWASGKECPEQMWENPNILPLAHLEALCKPLSKGLKYRIKAFRHFCSIIGGLSGKESACQCRRHRFDTWVGKRPWRRKWQPTPLFLPGKSHDRGAWQATAHGVTTSWTWLSNNKLNLHLNTKLTQQRL